MNPRFHVGTRKGIFTFEKQSGHWNIENTSFLGDNCSMLLHDPRPCEMKVGEEVHQADESLYAALDHGHFGVKLHRSIDRGKTWKEIGVPVYPDQPAETNPTDPSTESKKEDWSLKLIWELTTGGKQQPGKLWCGTVPGGLFTSEDAGNTWQLNETLWNHPSRKEWFGGGMDSPGLHSICVNPQNADHVLAGVSCGGIWETKDGGQTWQSNAKGMRAEYMPPERAFDEIIQDPHRLVQSPSDPNHLWVQHHNGIFRSINGGSDWSEIHDVKPSSFGFAVAVHPQKPETAWFIPAIKDEHRIPSEGKVIVNRTSDGGKTFQALTTGLPQQHAYDLVYRHALDIDDSGDILVFGSTTGSLWISEDGGDSWEILSSHRPSDAIVLMVHPRLWYENHFCDCHSREISESFGPSVALSSDK